MECKNHPQDNREEGRIPNPVSSGYSRDRQRKPATASSDSSYKTNARSKNSEKAGTTSGKPRRPETGRQHQQPPQRPTQGKPNNKNNFPYRDYRYSGQLRQTCFDKEQNQRYSPQHFAPSPALSTGSDLLSRSIMQLAEMQSRSLEIFAAQQKSQIEVYQELTRSNKEKEHDALFTSIPVFDGDRTQCEQWLDDMDQATRISGRDLRMELIKKSTGVVRQVIMMAHPDASDDDLINLIREDFSDAPTMNEAREELLHMRQKPEEQMRVYIYRYGRMHQRSSGIRAAEETHQHVIQDFIKSLKPKIKHKFANKFAEGRFQPRTLDHAFSLALDLEKKIQIADSFRDDIRDSRLLQWLMRSNLIPWTKPVLLTNLRLIIVPGTKIQKVTTMASHGTKKATASHGKTETTGRGKIKIKSHGKTIIKTKVINPATLALLCHRIKNSLFQRIVMKIRSRPFAP